MNNKSKFHVRYTDEELIIILQEFYKETGKCPVRDDFEKRVPNSSTFTSHFGSWDNSLEKAGLLDKKWYKQNYSKDDLIISVIQFFYEYGRIPTTKDTKSNKFLPSQSVFRRYFDSFDDVLKEADLYEFHNNGKFKQKYTDEELLQIFYEYYIRLCRLPTHIDLEDKNNNVPNLKTYRRRFGNIKNVVDLLNIYSGKLYKTIKTDEELILDLIWLENELQRTPMSSDLIYYDNVASTATYCKRFESWYNALKLANLPIPKDLFFKSKNGIKYFSYYEYIFSIVLDDLNIEFGKEKHYKDVILNYNGKMRFDFNFIYNDKIYYIEIFGLINRKNINYKEKAEYKIKLCNENNISLLCFYPKDFHGKSQDDLKNILLNKLII